MADGIMNYNEDVLNEFCRRLKKLSTDSQELSSKIKSQYSGLTSQGVLCEAVNDLSGKSGSAGLESSFEANGNLFAKHVSGMFEQDRRGAELADQIEIMQDFVGNNSMEINQFNSFILGKVDGESVNNGQASGKAKDIDDSIIAAQKLKDITGETAKEEKYDDTSVVGKSVLRNISGNQTQAQELDSSTSIGNTRLDNISGNQTQAQDYDDSSNVRGKSLQNISGDQTQAKEYDDSSNVVRRNIENINNNDKTQQQTYDDTSVVGKSVLRNINNNNEQGTESINDDAIAAAVSDFERTKANQLNSENEIRNAKNDKEA